MNSVTFTLNGAERTVRVVSYNKRYSVEVLYQINDITMWLPIDEVEDWHVCTDEFLQTKIAEADAVVARQFGIDP